MNEQFIKNLVEWIEKTYVEEGASYKTLGEGIFTVEAFWGDVIALMNERELESSLIQDFLLLDEELVRELRNTVINFLRKNLEPSIKKRIKEDEKEDNLAMGWN